MRLEMATRPGGTVDPVAALRALATAEALLDEFTEFARLPRGGVQRLRLADWLPSTVVRWLPDRTPTITLPDRDLAVEADPARLERAVGNLLRNAREASAEGVVRVSCTLLEGDDRSPIAAGSGEAGAERNHVRIRIWNAGAPVPESLGARIFIEGITTKPSGSGLGLAIARSIALQLGGTLTYRNVSGGVAFDLSLPCAPDRA
jgi:signal transduction histidine kinase